MLKKRYIQQWTFQTSEKKPTKIYFTFSNTCRKCSTSWISLNLFSVKAAAAPKSKVGHYSAAVVNTVSCVLMKYTTSHEHIHSNFHFRHQYFNVHLHLANAQTSCMLHIKLITAVNQYQLWWFFHQNLSLLLSIVTSGLKLTSWARHGVNNFMVLFSITFL